MSVGHIARGLEQAGVPTVTVMVKAFQHRAEQMKLPRTLLTRFPMGRPLGAVHDRERHADVVATALNLLVTATEAGTVVDYAAKYRTAR
ncbi:MAG: hypothetical protein O3B42_05615 [Actinomycetota bacterium]|nr:hypothetical protein [Actinomycetota bacterium]